MGKQPGSGNASFVVRRVGDGGPIGGAHVWGISFTAPGRTPHNIMSWAVRRLAPTALMMGPQGGAIGAESGPSR